MSDTRRSSGPQSAAPPPQQVDRVWRGFKLGVVTTIVLIALKFAVEFSPVGHQAEQMMMDLQQFRLAQAFRQDSPVAVVDISEMALTPRDPPLDATPVTDRHALQAIVAAVGAQSPVAIGIDVLLDPPAGHVVTDAERRLLETCLAMNLRGVPTFVAIFDGVVRGPAEWLGERRFGDLAAYALVPRPSEFQSTTSMVRTIDITVGEQAYHVNSMAHALALRVNTKALEGRAWTNWVAIRFPWLVARERAVTGDHFTTAEFLIDYGMVGMLERTAIRASTPAEISAAGQQLEDKVVLVGRGQIDRTTDVFTVPGRSSPVAGVYVHAAATHTLVSAPLFRLKFWDASSPTS